MAYLDAIADADRHISEMDAENEACIAREVSFAAQIHETLTKLVRTVPVQALSLPFVTYKSSGPVVAMQSVRDAMEEEGLDREAGDALMAVLVGSDCPLVAKWREAFATRWAQHHAGDLAEVTA